MPRKIKTKIDTDRLKATKVLRQYGIEDLERYMGKIQKNIQVFEEAIEREKAELTRTQGMINALEKDIKDIDGLCSPTTS